MDNLQFSFDEINDNYLANIATNTSQTSGLTKDLHYALDEDVNSNFQRLAKPNKSFREEIMDKINSKLLRSPNQTRCSSPSTANTLKSRFRLRKKSSSSENSCQNETNSITSTVNSLNSSLNLDLKRADSKNGVIDHQSKTDKKCKVKDKKSNFDLLFNIDADPVFNGLVNEDDLIENNGVMISIANNDRDIDNAWNFVKQLTSALRYLQDVVEKDILEQLSGASSILLEIVVSGYAKLRAHLIINEKSDLYVQAKNKMCSSLAELIKWSDAVLLYGEGALDRTNVCLVVNSVKDAVESLVKLCVDKHQRKIKLHSSNEVTVSELNDQIDKLNLNNLNNSFANIQYRSKPIIQSISTTEKSDSYLTSNDEFTNSTHSINCSSIACSSNCTVKGSKFFHSTDTNHHFNHNGHNHNSNFNEFNGNSSNCLSATQNLNNAQTNEKTLTDLIKRTADQANEQNCVPADHGSSGFNYSTIQQVITDGCLAANSSSNMTINNTNLMDQSKGQLPDRALPESNCFEMNSTTIFNGNLQPQQSTLNNNQSNCTLDTIPNAPKLPFKQLNYCNVAQIVDTSKCNQISIDLAPPLPPRLPATSKRTPHSSSHINRKIDFNKFSDLKFDHHLNQKLSQHLNQQFDLHEMSQLANQNENHHTNNQSNRESFNQFNKSQLLNGQLPKNALLVSSNSILSNNQQTSMSRQTRSEGNINFSSLNSLNLSKTVTNCKQANNQQNTDRKQTNNNLDQLVNEFTDYEVKSKHHSDNEVIKDFMQINKNISELAAKKGVNSSVSSTGSSMNSSSSGTNLKNSNGGSNSNNNSMIVTQPINSSANQLIVNDNACQIVFRKKQPSISEQTTSIVQLSESQLNHYLNSGFSLNDDKTSLNNRNLVKDGQSSNGDQQSSRPSSQYDNLSLSEFSEQQNSHHPSFNVHQPQLSSSSNLTVNSSSLATMNTQNSLNLSWQSNNFSSTISSSSSSNQIDSTGHLDPSDANRLSNRSSNGSSNRSGKYSTTNHSNLDSQSQSSYENEEDVPPQLPPKNKNISVYCQLFGTYTAPKDKCYRYSVHTVQEIYRSQATYQQVELSFNQQKEFHNLNNQFVNGFQHPASRHRLTTSSIATSSDDSMFSIDSFNSDSSKETNLLPLPPKKSVNRLAIPEKPEAYRYKNQLPAKFQHHHSSYQSNEDSQSEIKTAKLQHFDSLDFTCRPTSPASLQKSESGVSSTQSISKNDLNDETVNESTANSILNVLDVQSYLIYKKETVPPVRETPKKDNKKQEQVLNEFKEELQGGPVDALIVKATEVSSSTKKDFLYLEAFLATYRTFVSPIELINKLIYRFNRFIRLGDDKQTYAKNAFALLVRVVDDLCVTDCSNELMENLFGFFYSLILGGDLVLAKVLRNRVIEKIKAKRASATTLVQKPLSCLSITTKQCSLLDFKSEHIAEQMTLFDNELFVKIEPSELLIWSREQIEEPNLNKFTEHFNKMSYWARSRIIEENEPKEREKIAWKFIKVMKHLRKFNNFNSYLALLSSLDSAPIHRLDWPKSIVETLKEYSNLIDPSSSFRAYRAVLEVTEPPSIPYIGLILQDLTFVHIGNKDMLPDDVSVNFDKRWQIFNILDQLRKFRHSQYNFKKNEQIMNLFNNFDNYLSEEAVWQLSRQLKPKTKAQRNK